MVALQDLHNKYVLVTHSGSMRLQTFFPSSPMHASYYVLFCLSKQEIFNEMLTHFSDLQDNKNVVKILFLINGSFDDIFVTRFISFNFFFDVYGKMIYECYIIFNIPSTHLKEIFIGR